MSAVPSGGFNPFDPLDRLVQADLLEELQQDKAAAEWRTPLLMRPYQQEADAAVIDAFREHSSVLVEMATGLGKTIILSHIAKAWPGRVLIIAHRDELIRQAVSKLRTVLGEEPGIEMGSERLTDSLERLPRVIVSSVQTMCRPGRHMRFPSDYFGLLIIDEAHHAVAKSYADVMAHFRAAKVLGVTATAKRADQVAMRLVFETVAYTYGIEAAIADGWLVPIHQQCVEVEGLDFSQVRDVAGDFNEGELSAILTQETPLHRMASPIVELAGSRSTLVFCCSVAHAQLLAEVIDRYRFRSAAWLSGETPIEQRRETIERFKKGDLQFLLNVQLFLEGFDCPNTSLVVMGRPTKSLGLYCLDAETEILTEDGWKGPGSIRSTDRAAAWKEGQVHWSPILAIIEREVDAGERMVQLDSPALSIRVTEDHRMLGRIRHGRAHTFTSWSFATARYMASLKDGWQLPVSGEMEVAGLPLSDDEIRFIGWFLTDGTLNRCNGAIAITQAAHQPFHEDIRACLVGCGFKYGLHIVDRATKFAERSRMYIYTVSKGKPRGRDSHLRGWGALEPYIDKDFSPLMEGLSSRQLAVLLEAVHYGDGMKQPKNVDWVQRSYHIGTGNRTFADRLQSLCVRRGFRCNLHVDPRAAKHLGADFYVLHIKPKTAQWVGAGNATDRPHLTIVPALEGEKVWCVQTDTGTIITRRHGKVCVLGNCQVIGRGTRPLPGTVDGIETPEARRLSIARSAKPNMVVLDFAGNAGRHKIITATDILGGKFTAPARQYAREAAEASDSPQPVQEMLEEGELVSAYRMERDERLRRIRAQAQYQVNSVSPFDRGSTSAPHHGEESSRGESATARQIWKLRTLGVSPDRASTYTKRQASAVISKLLEERGES